MERRGRVAVQYLLLGFQVQEQVVPTLTAASVSNSFNLIDNGLHHSAHGLLSQSVCALSPFTFRK